MDLRELKALEIAARSQIAFADGVWLVPSQAAPGTKYRVTPAPAPSRTCEDFQLRQQPCKHLIAARLVRASDCHGTDPNIVVDDVPKRPTYKQDWPAYNRARETEKDRFQELLYDLTRGLPEPPRAKTGRKPTPMADLVFASAFKVFSTFSARRFGCDLKDAYEKGYLSGLMNPRSISAYLESPEPTPILQALIVRSSLPHKTVETAFAPDSTGFSTSRFVRWFDEKYGQERSGRDWVKAHAICGVKTNVVTAVTILDRDAGDSPQFKPLVEKAAENFTVAEVAADKAYLSHDNLELVEALGGAPFIPFKSNSSAGESGSLWERLYHYYQFRREDFLTHYHQRSNAESPFSMVKAKFRDDVRSKDDVAMKNEVLCKFLCHNIVVVHQSQVELEIEAVFWGDKPVADAAELPAVLPMIRRPV